MTHDIHSLSTMTESIPNMDIGLMETKESKNEDEGNDENADKEEDKEPSKNMHRYLKACQLRKQTPSALVLDRVDRAVMNLSRKGVKDDALFPLSMSLTVCVQSYINVN